MDLVVDVYRLTDGFPQREVYSLTDQIRRAAVSIPNNIAEGQAHYNKREFLHFLRHAAGSPAELETQLLIARKLDYAPEDHVKPILEHVYEVGRALSGLIKSLSADEV